MRITSLIRLGAITVIVPLERMGSTSHWPRKSRTADSLGRNAICGGVMVVAVMIVMLSHIAQRCIYGFAYSK